MHNFKYTLFLFLLIFNINSCGNEKLSKPENYTPSNEDDGQSDLKVEVKKPDEEATVEQEETPTEEASSEENASTETNIDPDPEVVIPAEEVPTEEVPTEDTRKPENNNPVHFSLKMTQTFKPCPACGILFDWQNVQSNKPKLVIEYTDKGQNGTLTLQHGLDGMENAFSIGASDSPSANGIPHIMLLKNGPVGIGYFYANIQAIPINATVTKATLYLHLNEQEGLSNDDKSSILKVFSYSKVWDFNNNDFRDGTELEEIREIKAQEDFWDKGISKANPIGGFDFTTYAQKLQQAR